MVNFNDLGQHYINFCQLRVAERRTWLQRGKIQRFLHENILTLSQSPNRVHIEGKQHMGASQRPLEC